MTDQQRARAEAHSRILADLGLTRADAALFATLHYGLTTTPDVLPGYAAAEGYSPVGPRVTEEECRVAQVACLARGWLQLVDEPACERIAGELRAGGYLGPIYHGGGPEVGSVDFTDAGLALWRRFCELTLPGRNPPFSYTDVVHEKTARFFRTAAAAAAAVAGYRSQDEVVAVTGPTRTGPWRAQWWRRFPEGFRVDVEERRRWQGRCPSGGETCCLDRFNRTAEPDRLQRVLDRHHVRLAEWLVMEGMERGWSRDSADTLCRGAAEAGNRVLGVAIPAEACREGLETCLRNGWLRVVDRAAVDEVRSLLAADPAVLALPETATGRTPDSYWLGGIDFTPAGAALYRMLSAEWLGPDWEDELDVSRVYYWEEHHYCESAEGFDHVAEEHVAKGNVVRASRVVPIGPWCVYWWERFPAGYRLELEIGEP